MKFNAARQSLPIGLVTLITLAVTALACSRPVIGSVDTVDAMQAPLERVLLTFQWSYPLWASFIGVVLVLFSGLYIGRFTIRYGFYPFKTCLPMALYGIMACGMYVSEEYLAVYSASALLVLSLKYFYAAFGSDYAFSNLFRASVLLGSIPLVYSPSLPLLLLAVVVIFIFKRTFREFIVSFGGLALPLFVTCYIDWAAGCGFTATVINMWHTMISDSGYVVFDEISPTLAIIFCLLLFIAICSIFLYAVDARYTAFKARGMLLLDIITFAAILSMLFLQGSTDGVMLLAAVPAAMIMPVMLVRINRILSSLLYISLLVFCILNIF